MTMETKRRIKVRFMDYWSDFPRKMDSYLLLRLLRKHYDVKICEDADYVFFSAMGDSHWAVPDRCVKIFHTGENVAPDFNACDYAIGFEWMDYGDRYIRFPLYLFYDRVILDRMLSKHDLPEGWDLSVEKPDFCSFLVSNPCNPFRNEAFQELGRYRRVDSGGKFLNNVGGPVADKFAFESRHKFSLCYENGAHPGYTTEKLVEALAARTVPVYWGDPDVGKVFNTAAFIDVSAYDSFADVVRKVEELDRDDEKYMRMLREPALLPEARSVDAEYARLEAWLTHIVDQPLEKAYRRNRAFFGRKYVESRLRLDLKSNWKAWLGVLSRKVRNKLSSNP